MKATRLFGIFEEKGSIYTEAFAKGQVYDEAFLKIKGKTYRSWNPKKSKIGAYIKKGARDIFIRPGQKVLYLGVASGTTASHLSDILGKEGMLFGVDMAFRVMMDFYFLSKERTNLSPIFGDARNTEALAPFLPKQVDVIVQDVAQRDQAHIFLKNIDMFLKPGGFGLLSVKARSVDVRKKPKDVFKEVRKELEEKLTIVDFRLLDPFEKDHVMIIVKK